MLTRVLGLAGDYLYIICAKGRTYLAKHILLQAIPKNELIGPKTGADDIKSDEFDRNNTGKSAG